MIVVHGAGPQITEEMRKRGIAVEFVQGRRRTSPAALEVVRESMEAVNAALCVALGDARRPRVRPSRRAARGAGAAAGPGRRSAAVPAAEGARCAALPGRVPVVAPLAVGPLNVNADDAAAALALGLGATQPGLPHRRRRALRRRRSGRRDRRRRSAPHARRGRLRGRHRPEAARRGPRRRERDHRRRSARTAVVA